MDWLKLVHGALATPEPGFRPGDEVRVWYKIIEKDKERTAQFEGIVIRSRGSSPSRTFTVRRVTYGEGVERVFPMDSKTVSKIEVLRRGRVKRSRLYYLRTVVGKTRIASANLQSQAEKSSGNVPVVDATTQESVSAGRIEDAMAATGKPAEAPKPRN